MSPRRRSRRGLFVLGVVLAAPGAARGGLSLDGVSQYVTFGSALKLGSPTFTVETWFNWTGGGVAANTGTGGALAIPLVSKLASEQDGDARDGNYFLGIRPTDGVLVADLEEGAGGTVPGKNHPVFGSTSVTSNVWHHAAVTYNGSNWVLLLDGNQESTVAVGQPPRFDSIQHAALGSTLNSTGTPQGYFAGLLDEVRLWNYARSSAQVASNRYAQIASAPGLLGRWSLDETSGLVAHDSSGNGVDGTLINGPAWVRSARSATEVVTPMRLNVIDAQRTAAIRQGEMRTVAPVFRFDPAVIDQVEKNFRGAFLNTRERFLAALTAAFPKRSPNAPMSADPRFEQLVAGFQKGNWGFPVSSNVARLWAEGHVGNTLQSELAGKMREVMGRYICPDNLPAEVSIGPGSARVYSMSFTNPTPDFGAVQGQSLICARTNFWTLSRARADLKQRWPAGDPAVANFMSGLLKENCVFDGELTRQSRARHAESFYAADRYEGGQILVRKGQIIDAKISAALEELKAQLAATERETRAAAAQAQAASALRELEVRTALSEFKSQHFGQQNRWLFAGLLVVVVTSSVAVWQLARARRGQRGSSLPVARGAGADGEMETTDWSGLGLGSEGQASEAAEAARRGLMASFSQWFRHKLVRGLLAQRSHLLSTHEMAEQELAELEDRLARLQTPMEQRLRLYKQRILELERELAAKGEENRELLQAKIELTRRRLEVEQGKATGES